MSASPMAILAFVSGTIVFSPWPILNYRELTYCTFGHVGAVKINYHYLT
jgi:hypothetical protein